jgi:ribosomal protein S5
MAITKEDLDSKGKNIDIRDTIRQTVAHVERNTKAYQEQQRKKFSTTVSVSNEERKVFFGSNRKSNKPTRDEITAGEIKRINKDYERKFEEAQQAKRKATEDAATAAGEVTAKKVDVNDLGWGDLIVDHLQY